MNYGDNLEYCLRQTADDKQKDRVRIYIRARRNKAGELLELPRLEKEVMQEAYNSLRDIPVPDPSVSKKMGEYFDIKLLQGMKHPEIFVMSSTLLWSIVIDVLEKESIVKAKTVISEKWKGCMKESEFLKLSKAGKDDSDEE